MASTTDAIILAGLYSHLEGLVLSTALQIAWPNAEFAPPKEGYMRVQHLPSETGQVTLGDNGQNRHAGLLQISVMWPAGEGDIKPLDIAGEVIARFKRGTVITHGNEVIRIIRPPSLAPSLQDDPYTQYPITIAYQADADNPA